MPHSDAYDHLDPDCSDGEPTRKSFERLAFSILSLSRAIGRLGDETNNNTILRRIAEMEKNIMSAISDFLAKQLAFNARQQAAVDALTNTAAGLAEDVQTLNDKITELQNSPGGVTPEDQAIIHELQTQGEALTGKLEAFATALETLNALTPPKTPPPVVIPPTEPTE